MEEGAREQIITTTMTNGYKTPMLDTTHGYQQQRQSKGSDEPTATLIWVVQV